MAGGAAAGGAHEPCGDARRRVAEGRENEVLLPLAQLSGKVAQDVVADGGNIVDESEEVGGGHKPHAGRGGCRQVAP